MHCLPAYRGKEIDEPTLEELSAGAGVFLVRHVFLLMGCGCCGWGDDQALSALAVSRVTALDRRPASRSQIVNANSATMDGIATIASMTSAMAA